MKGSKMITRNDIETFANRHASFFGGNIIDATAAEACFIFGSGFDKSNFGLKFLGTGAFSKL